MPKKPAGMEQLLQGELQDLLDAEKQLVRAIPKMAKAAENEELEQALTQHLEVTKGHVERLSQVFESLEMPARSRPCKGMKGIVEEGSEMLQEDLGPGLLDSAIAGAARKVEHYEMMAYESVRSLANQLGRQDAVRLLEENLREEIEADKTLAQISKQLIKQAGRGAKSEEMAAERANSKSGSKKSGARNSGSGKRGAASSSRRGSSRGGHAAHAITDHDEIQQWAEERGAVPTCVRGTGGKGDMGMIRLEFPAYGGEKESLQEVPWDEWFEKFDEHNLALMVQETSAEGQQSNFNKLVKRTTAQQQPKAKAAR